MSETAFSPQPEVRTPIQVEFLDPAGRPVQESLEAQLAPTPLTAEDWATLDEAIGRARLASELGQGELTVNDQAYLLHDQIYGVENGIPSVNSFRSAQQFAENVHFDPNAVTIDDSGQVVHGAYYGVDGERLDPAIAEDVLHAAQPENWVQSKSHRHVVGRARDVLRANGHQATEAEAPTVGLATAVASRAADYPEAVDSEAFQRLLDMDREARRVLRQQRHGKDLIADAEQRNAYEVAQISASPVNVGVAHANVSPDRAAPGANERTLGLEPLAPIEYATGQGRATVDYEAHGHGNVDPGMYIPEDMADPEILQLLINDSRVRSREDVAVMLYPEKMMNGASRFGASRWGNVVRVADTDIHGGLHNLTPAERAEVDGFARQVAVARRYEDAVPEEFRRHNQLPNHQQVAAELFPDVEKLTPQHWAVVRNSMDRLRAIRLEQVRPDYTTPIAMRWARIREATGNAWRTARNAAEHLRPENIRNRVGLAVGATALTAAMIGGNSSRMWGRILPAVREHISERLMPAIREALANFDVRDVARVIGVRLQLLASDARSRLTEYVQQRVEAARNADNADKLRVAALVTATAALAAVAVHEYMRVRHNIVTGGTGASHHDILQSGMGTDSGVDTGGNTSHGATGTTLSDVLPDNKPSTGGQTTHAAQPTTAEIGTFDGSKRIMGYPKGSIGYRVLEHAQQSGVNPHSKGDANRLIEATLKMDHMSWSDKPDATRKIALLSAEQMQKLLKR